MGFLKDNFDDPHRVNPAYAKLAQAEDRCDLRGITAAAHKLARGVPGEETVERLMKAADRVASFFGPAKGLRLLHEMAAISDGAWLKTSVASRLPAARAAAAAEEADKAAFRQLFNDIMVPHFERDCAGLKDAVKAGTLDAEGEAMLQVYATRDAEKMRALATRPEIERPGQTMFFAGVYLSRKAPAGSLCQRMGHELLADFVVGRFRADPEDANLEFFTRAAIHASHQPRLILGRLEQEKHYGRDGDYYARCVTESEFNNRWDDTDMAVFKNGVTNIYSLRAPYAG